MSYIRCIYNISILIYTLILYINHVQIYIHIKYYISIIYIIYQYQYISKAGDRRRGQPEGSLFQ